MEHVCEPSSKSELIWQPEKGIYWARCECGSLWEMYTGYERLRTPDEWQVETGITVHDPDGWRVDGKDWSDPISKAEWDRRMVQSTISVVIDE